MSTKKKPNLVQLRLLINPEWIPELDTLARARHLTRLGIIRHFLRLQIDDALASYQEFLNAKEARRATKTKLDAYLDEKDF
jgi:hypothetical protein